MSCPYTSPQNGKAECIIHSVNNVIRTLLIQASLPGRYWAEGLHTATYMLNRLPTTVIQVVCPHLALFGSAPSYEHMCIFGCTGYLNTTITVPHKLSPCSTWCVLLGYSADHKGYHYLDLATNCLIVSQHVVFDEDNFPLDASPSLTNLDFLCESGPMVFTIGTHLTTAGTSPPAPRRPARDIPLGFEPPVANLPAPTVPPGFLPRVATTAAPPLVTIGPPARTWLASPVTYVRREVGAGTVGTCGASGSALSQEVGAGATGTCGAPGPTLRPEVGTRAVGTHGAPGATLRWEVGAGAAGPHGALGAALRLEVGAGAAGTRGALRATLHWEVGTGAAPRAALSRAEGAGASGTRGDPGPALSPEVGAGAARTCGAPGAALCREVGTRVTVTHGDLGAVLSWEVGAGAAGTHGGLGAALSQEPGTTPPRPSTRG
jgi:hypothetical protein